MADKKKKKTNSAMEIQKFDNLANKKKKKLFSFLDEIKSLFLNCLRAINC